MNRSDSARDQREHQEVVAHYGRKCSRCPETQWHLLILHHPNEDGRQHRQELSVPGGRHFYAKLRKDNYPNPHIVNGVSYALELICAKCHALHHSTSTHAHPGRPTDSAPDPRATDGSYPEWSPDL